MPGDTYVRGPNPSPFDVSARRGARWLIRVRLRLAPPATLRDHLLNLLFQTVRVWRQAGLRLALRQAQLQVATWWPRKTTERNDTPTQQTYQAWIAETEPGPEDWAQQKQSEQAFSYRPLFSFIVMDDAGSLSQLRATIESVMAQTYSRWEFWLIVKTDEEIAAQLSQRDPRIHTCLLDRSQEVAANWQETLSRSCGEFVGLLDPGDCLTPHMLCAIVERLNDKPVADLVYFDEDQIATDGGTRQTPWFKPDWSPELLLSINYLAHAFIRRSLLDEAGFFDLRGSEAAQWDLIFRCVERTDHILHIPQILYHRQGEMTSSTEAGLRAVEAHLQRRGFPQPIVQATPSGSVRATWPVAGKRVSIIILTKDKVEFLRKCMASLLRVTAYADFEVLIVDTGSREPATQAYYEELNREPRVHFLRYSAEFNYSAANNFATRFATGQFFLFLNNDTEALEADWLTELVRWAERPEVGAVGAKLLYPDGMIQHAGVVIGMEGHSSHVFWGAPEGYTGPFGSVEWYRNYLAVTAACVMMRREVFESLGGFDENYRLVFSDVEICLRVIQHGYRVVYTPFARLRHHEGRSRGNHMPLSDIELAYHHMQAIVEAGDPCFNPNLSYTKRLPMLAQRGEESRLARLERIVHALHSE